MSYLKHRVKKIEKAIVPTKKHKVWIVRCAWDGDKGDSTAKEKAEKTIKAIKDGKTKHSTGEYYQEGDVFFILNVIFTDQRPDENAKYKLGEKVGPKKNEPNEAEIKQRIKVLKKKKQDLERKIKEKENV